jgi:hypothetical protein
LTKNILWEVQGYLQNQNEIGHGYEDAGVTVNYPKKTQMLNFVAPMVHDFAWAADKNYMHDIVKGQMMLTYTSFIKRAKKTIENWKKLSR